jgi:uncharacterized OsmC-like protein
MTALNDYIERKGCCMEFKMKEEVGFYSELGFGRLDVAGDEEYGFRPYQLLVASVAVCSGGVLRKILKKMRLEFSDITIHTETQRNEEQADRIEKITVHFKIRGKHLSENKLEKAMELTRKNCSMVQSVVGSIEVQETFEIIPE